MDEESSCDVPGWLLCSGHGNFEEAQSLGLALREIDPYEFTSPGRNSPSATPQTEVAQELDHLELGSAVSPKSNDA